MRREGKGREGGCRGRGRNGGSGGKEWEGE